MNEPVLRSILPVGFDLQFHSDGRVDVLIDKTPGDDSLRIVRFWTRDPEVLQRFLGRLIVEQAMKQRSRAMTGFTQVRRARQAEASA